MSRAFVAVGGPPGSGKSTVGRKLAEALAATYVSAGDQFRAEARRRGLDLEAFGRYAERHPEVDRALDESMRSFWTPGHVLDGRIQGPLARRAGVPVRYVVIDCDAEVRAARVAGRDGISPTEAARRIAEREASEARRYWAFYGVDLRQETPDFLVDSTRRSPDEVVARLLDFLGETGR